MALDFPQRRCTFLLTLLWAACALVASGAPFRSELANGSASYIVVDTTYKKILASHKADERLPVGGLTKVLTACVVLDWLDATETDRTRLLIVPSEIAQIPGGNPLGLQPGDQISIRDALFSMLLASDHAATLTLAKAVGNEMAMRASAGQGGIDFFVRQMNALAAARGMSRSQFINPHGMDGKRSREQNISTSEDLAKLAFYAIRKPSLNFIVSQREREVQFTRAGQTRAFRIKSTNQMLGQYGVVGLKTALNPFAGQCLMAHSRRKDKITHLEEGAYLRVPYNLIVVTLDASDRFAQTAQLIENSYAAYDAWIHGDRLLPRDQILAVPD